MFWEICALTWCAVCVCSMYYYNFLALLMVYLGNSSVAALSWDSRKDIRFLLVSSVPGKLLAVHINYHHEITSYKQNHFGNCNNERPWGRFKSDACVALSKVDDTRDFIENTFKGSLIPVRLSALDLSAHPFTEQRARAAQNARFQLRPSFRF